MALAPFTPIAPKIPKKSALENAAQALGILTDVVSVADKLKGFGSNNALEPEKPVNPLGKRNDFLFEPIKR